MGLYSKDSGGKVVLTPQQKAELEADPNFGPAAISMIEQMTPQEYAAAMAEYQAKLKAAVASGGPTKIGTIAQGGFTFAGNVSWTPPVTTDEGQQFGQAQNEEQKALIADEKARREKYESKADADYADYKYGEGLIGNAYGQTQESRDLSLQSRGQGEGLMSQAQDSRLQADAAMGASWGARSQQADDRNLMLGLNQRYDDVLSGKAPSVAELQMQQGLDHANQSAMGLAASTRGGGANALMAMRQAGMQQQANSLGNVRDAAMLRAKEQEMARAGQGGLLGQMSNASGQMRGQDFQAAQGYQAQRSQDYEGAGMYQKQREQDMGLMKNDQNLMQIWQDQQKTQLQAEQQHLDYAQGGGAANMYGVYGAAQKGALATEGMEQNRAAGLMDTHNAEIKYANQQEAEAKSNQFDPFEYGAKKLGAAGGKALAKFGEDKWSEHQAEQKAKKAKKDPY